ncbi:16197_t:CDS:2 [Funneliformis mosseae]|uniref:16197_t:CDS:1 n=1 Tax=Funneliformis mosseae TaxID=27381 RepID=A0A9N9HPJ2_FUNMO|nr:16197_t:CDS:2 [Funneliformis mosseae]
MENIVEAYNSDSSNNESENKQTFLQEVAVTVELDSHSSQNSIPYASFNKQKRKRSIEGTITRFSHSQHSTEIPQKKVKGYISKREKLKQEAEKLKANINEHSIAVNQENRDTASYVGTLLKLPNLIISALEDTRDESKARFNTIPKQQIISLKTEHVNGVNSILWCGSFGQVLASASMDGTVRIWDVFRSKQCVRTLRHEGAVKDIRWDHTRNHILSGGYDKIVKLTDIEKGTKIQSFPHSHIVTSLRYHPTQSNIFVSGMIKDGIYSWDIRSNKIIKETKKFWGSVNDLEFFPDGNSLLTCSDYVVRNASDKNIVVWDYDSLTTISNQIYQETYSCTALRIHPSKNHFIAQSNANYIPIFGMNKPWKLDKRKRFEGHLVNGHPIKCNFSPEPDLGRFIVSGDSNGGLCVLASCVKWGGCELWLGL